MGVKRLEEGGQLPCRHLVQGEFAPSTTISQILDWLSPLLLTTPSPESYLYTAPPHTRLDKDSNLLDLGLFPAALLHLSTPSSGPDYLEEDVLSSLSNSVGAQQAAAESRQQSLRRLREKGVEDSATKSVPESRSSGPAEDEERGRGSSATSWSSSSGASSSASSSSGQKLPKWFKPGK